MQAMILEFSYVSCAGAFLFLTLLIVWSWKRSRYAFALLAATTLTTVWGLVIAATPWLDIPALVSVGLDSGRLAGWLVFLGLALGVKRTRRGVFNSFVYYPAIALAVAGGVAVTVMTSVDPLFLPAQSVSLIIGTLSMGLAVLGLVLVENLYRNTLPHDRWNIKFLCFGLGGLFGYDFLYFADTILFRSPSLPLYLARGFVTALTAPLIAVSISRTRAWSLDIHVSRQLVVHSAALVAAGLYLMIMAGAGYFVRQFGGTWGSVFQITFLAAAALLLVVLFFSTTLRARAKTFISRHFYSSKYDYREEWLRFVKTVSSDHKDAPLPLRTLHAIAQVVDSPAAALWMAAPQRDHFHPVCQWNFGDHLPAEASGSSLLAFMDQERGLTRVSNLRLDAARFADSDVVRWLVDEKRAWCLLPMIHRNAISAFIVLGTPRADLDIDWEVQELLMTLGQQAASYLAEEEAANALAAAEKFDAMNKRFAFVAHDIKNVVNQLSLMLKNAEKHGGNPEFQADMLATITSAVARMSALLKQLADPAPLPAAAPDKVIAVTACLRQLGQTWQQTSPAIVLDLEDMPALVHGQEERLVSAIDHLIQNAVEAVSETPPGTGRVILRSRCENGSVWIEVEDNGPGMDPDFMRERLVQPLSSDKEAGFGMGVYQVRVYIEGMGGQLDVETQPGKGTTMRIRLPLTGAPREEAGPAGTEVLT